MKNNTKVVLIFAIILFLSITSNTYKLEKVRVESFTDCKNCGNKSNIDNCLQCTQCGWCQTMGQDGKCVQQDAYGFPLFKEFCQFWTPGGYYPFNEALPIDSYPYYYQYGYPWHNPIGWFRGWPWKRVGLNRVIRRRRLGRRRYRM